MTPHFQPIYDIQEGHRVGLELLSRWRDDNGNFRTPDSFSWMFRDHRLAAQLTMHVVAAAFSSLQASGSLGKGDIREFWINVTDKDLLNTEFIFELQNVLSKFDIDWSQIVIEINENSVLGSKTGRVFSSLKEIRRRGGRVALDDFGAGQSGLTHVCQWPVDIIKIDREIVQRVGADPGADIVVEALVLVAARLNQTVVAEGIELETQLERMQRLGCNLGQGFALGRPMSAKDLTAIGHYAPLDENKVAV